MAQQAALRAEKLRKEFGRGAKKTLAVDDVGFTLRKGEVLGFLGPNGAGKTTTVKMLCGLIRPSGGRVWVGGRELSEAPGEARARIGAVLEGSRNTYWRLTVAENLEYFAHLRGHAAPDFRSRTARLLDLLGLSEKRDHLVQTLSRGMQQKVALACALCTDPDILLLDEPTLGLDLHSSLAIQQGIRRMAGSGMAILLTTHQMEIAQRVSDRIAIMKRGKIVALDQVGNLLDLFALGLYRIHLHGCLPSMRQTQIEELFQARIESQGEAAILHVALKESRRLYDLIDILRESKVVIHSIERADPDLGEIYLKLIEEKNVETACSGA